METEQIIMFQTVKRCLLLLDLEVNKRPLHRKQLLRVVTNIFAIVLLALYLVNDANTAREYMSSISITVIGVLVFIAFWSVIFETTTIYDFIDRYETIINGRFKNPRSKAIYERMNYITELICKSLKFFIIDVGVLALVFPIAIYSFFMYFTTDLGPDAFQLPFPTWFPFNWKNPIGYLIAVLLQIRIAAMALRFIGCFVTFGVTSFLFSTALAKDLENDIRSINKNARKKRTRAHTVEQFNEFVRFTRFRRFFPNFTKNFRIILISLYLGCMCAILISLLMIQIDLAQIDIKIDSLVLLEPFILCFGALLLVFVACESGQRFSNAFSEVGGAFSQLDFYLLPIKIRRILPAVIIYMQEPMFVKFFGNLSATREQFKRVIRAVYQYFTILREFYN